MLHSVDRLNQGFERLHLSWTNMILMESVSFIDEYEQNFFYRCEPEFKDMVVKAKKICQPVLRKVKDWRDLKDFRNQIVAHPWRDKNGNFVIPDLNKHSIPRNWFEYAVLVNLMGYIFDIISSVFVLEMNKMFVYMQTLVPPDKAKTTYHNLTDEHLEMASEVNRIAKEQGQNYELRIIGYTFD